MKIILGTWLEEDFSLIVQLKNLSAIYREGVPASSVESQHSGMVKWALKGFGVRHPGVEC